jgi:hypothetical protein
LVWHVCQKFVGLERDRSRPLALAERDEGQRQLGTSLACQYRQATCFRCQLDCTLERLERAFQTPEESQDHAAVGQRCHDVDLRRDTVERDDRLIELDEGLLMLPPFAERPSKPRPQIREISWVLDDASGSRWPGPHARA